MPTDLHKRFYIFSVRFYIFSVRFYILIHHLHLQIPDQQTVLHRMMPTRNQERGQLLLQYVDNLEYEKRKHAKSKHRHKYFPEVILDA